MNTSRRPRSPWTVGVPIITAAAGLLFATSATTAGGADLRGGGSDLPGLIRSRTAAVERRTAENAALRRDVAAREDALPGGPELRALRGEEADLERQAGLTPVSGPAVQVTLTDAPVPASGLPDGVTVDDVVVHQQDVQAVVNALWAGGAEAMTIQDQRVVSTSAVRCVGNTLILGGRVYSPPFVVTAIGERRRLHASLDADPAVRLYREYADRLGLGYDVADLDADMPGHTGVVDPVHAVPRAASVTHTPS